MYEIVDLLNGAKVTESYADEALAHGVRVVHVTVNNFTTIDPYPDFRSSMSELASIRRHYEGLSGIVKMIETPRDIDRAREAGKLGVVLGYQNIPDLGRDLGLLELFRDLGVRIFQISHNARSPYADGCDETANAGLSSAGRELISELNRLGILIDLSHTGERSSIEAAELSSVPVAATHANARAICDNVRNKSDAVLDAIATTGGLIGVCYLPPAVTREGRPTASHMTAHAVHIRDKIGASGLAIGSDFIDGQPDERYANFMKRPEVYGTWPWQYPVSSLAEQQSWLASLAENGFSEDEILATASANALRVINQVWREET